MRKILVESRGKNLVEHQIIKLIRKFNSIICRFFATHSQDNAFSLLHVWGAKKRFLAPSLGHWGWVITRMYTNTSVIIRSNV